MARQPIINGNVANDGSGDTLREGARKINENFVELYSKQLPIQTGNQGRYLQTNGTQAFWSTLNIVNIPGNAGTVTNGVYTSETYSDPDWIDSLDGSKLTGTVVATNGVVTTQSYSNPAWITSLSFDKITGTIVATNGVVTTGSYVNPSWIVSLDGSKLTGTVVATNGVVTNNLYADPDWIVSLDGGKIVNGVVTTATYDNPTWINSLSGSKITGNISGNAGTVTNGVYTTGTYGDPSWITSLSPTKVLPSQASNNGKFLTTDGSILSWASLPAQPNQGLDTTDDVTFNSVTATTTVDADIITSTNYIETPELIVNKLTTNTGTDLELVSNGAIAVTNSVFRLKGYTQGEIDALPGLTNGDLVYNTTTNRFQGFANGLWVDLH